MRKLTNRLIDLDHLNGDMEKNTARKNEREREGMAGGEKEIGRDGERTERESERERERRNGRRRKRDRERW